MHMKIRPAGAYGLAGVMLLAAAASVSPQTPVAPTRQALIDELVVANHILANEGVLDGYGHVSVRNPANPNQYFLARAGAPALVTAADITEYDLNSKSVTNESAIGYTERFIHGEIYKVRPDVMAVVHCHCPEVIPFGVTSVPMQPIYHMGFFIGEGVPVFEIRKAGGGATDMLIRTLELGRALAQTLGNKSAALMRGHGAVIAATSLHLVVGKSYFLNLNARLQLQAMQLGGGKVTYLAPEEAKQATDYERSWDFWKSNLSGR